MESVPLAAFPFPERSRPPPFDLMPGHNVFHSYLLPRTIMLCLRYYWNSSLSICCFPVFFLRTMKTFEWRTGEEEPQGFFLSFLSFAYSHFSPIVATFICLKSERNPSRNLQLHKKDQPLLIQILILEMFFTPPSALP